MAFAREAWRGLKAEVRAAPSLRHKLSILVPGTATMVKELAIGGLAVLPFGISSALLYRRLPSLTEFMTQRQQAAAEPVKPVRSKYGVLLQAEQAYGPGPRHKLDIYVPQAVGERLSQGENPMAPVVFFTHGGVWASGDTWHYSRMATRLAQAGCLVFVHTYTLYPDALVPQMVDEVSAALTWALEHAPHYGGNPEALTAIGHSAGTHLLSLALMRRAGLPVGPREWQMAAAQPSPAAHSGAVQPASGAAGRSAPTPAAASSSSSAAAAAAAWQPPQPFDDLASAMCDTRMPAAFLGMAGVFDIDKHWEHERARGVHHLSMMSRAMGGFGNHACLSPSQVLNRFADCLHQANAASQTPFAASPEQQQRAYGSWQQGAQQRLNQQQQTGMWLHSGQLELQQTDGAGGFSQQTPAHGTGLAVDIPQPASDSAPASFYQSFPLRGEAIPYRSRLVDPLHTAGSIPATGSHWQRPGGLRSHSLQQHAASDSQDSWVVHAGSAPPTSPPPDGSDSAAAAAAAAARLAAGLAKLPRTFLLAGCFDHVVPWHESVEMMHALQRCHVASRVLMYQWADHGSFVVDWKPLKLPGLMAEVEGEVRDDEMAVGAGNGVSSMDALAGLVDWNRDVVLLVTSMGQQASQRSTAGVTDGAQASAASGGSRLLDMAVPGMSRL